MDTDVGHAPRPKRLNVLTLDGGGVRGLSTLLILQDLMSRINVRIRNSRGRGDVHCDLQPHDIFDLVAGTSTGGLIATMLGKLGMTLDECLAAYRGLSKTIFGKKHLRGRLTFGLAPSIFSGSRLRAAVCKLLRDKGFDENVPMEYINGRDKIACAVVCREQENESRYSDILPNPVRLCSLPCPDTFTCLVWEAARATSAAPTYFPAQKIAGRSFVDGGMEHNNPSWAIFDHYTEVGRVAESRRTSVATEPHLYTAGHGSLDFSRVRIINLGTGTKAHVPNGNRPGIFANLKTPPVRFAGFLRKNLAEMVVNSENTAIQMRIMARVSKDSGSCNFMFERFSADNGLCLIKLDKFGELEAIAEKTRLYLETLPVQGALQRVAEEIADEYLEYHFPVTRSATLSVPSYVTPQRLTTHQPLASTPQTSQDFRTDATAHHSLSLYRDNSDTSNSTATTDFSAEVVNLTHPATPQIPARQEPDITGPAERLIHTTQAADTVAPICS